MATYEIIDGKIPSAQKIVLYGPEGIGKSTFASKMPTPLLIDTEGGTKEFDVRRLPAPTSWTMLLEEITQVKNDPTICETLVIDTADWAEMLCIRGICEEMTLKGIEDLGYGKGYVYLAERFGTMLNLLSDVIAKGVNVLITAHAMMRKFEQPDEMGAYDRWELKLQKKTAPLLKEWADMLLFANYETFVVNVDNQGAAKGKNKVQGGRRVMYTAHHPCWDAKNRHGLPEKTDFDFDVIADILSPLASPAPERYWVHESGSTAISRDEDTARTFEGEADITEVDKAEYDRVNQLNTAAAADPGIPKGLADLMTANGVGEDEIRRAVYAKGYYPEDTPVKDYDPNFIAGVLIGAWDQVFALIKEHREVAEKFNK